MDLVQAEDRAKLRREKSREAINLALENRWEEAAEVNRLLLRLFPEDVEAYNRLGKALLELGRYGEARAAFEEALRLDPHNQISRKNLERLDHLKAMAATGPRAARRITPHLFIEESGKSATTVLQNTAPRAVLARLGAGDVVNLSIHGHNLVAETLHGEFLGVVEPRLAVRLIPLIRGGNRYEAAVVSVANGDVTLIIREVYRHPDLVATPSFPIKGTEEYRAYLRGAIVPLEEEAEEEAPEWQEGEEEGEEGEEGEEDEVGDLEEASDEIAPDGVEESEQEEDEER